MESHGRFKPIECDNDYKTVSEYCGERLFQPPSKFQRFAQAPDVDVVDETFVSGLVLGSRTIKHGMPGF